MTDLIKAVEGLLPCPFCGEHPSMTPMGFVVCSTRLCCEGMMLPYYWNTRQTPPAPTPASEGDLERVAALMAERDRKLYPNAQIMPSHEHYCDKAREYEMLRSEALQHSKPDGEGKL